MTPEMIRNRAEAMSCGGCHQNSNNKEIAPNIHWPNSAGFVHVTEEGELSKALTKQFLPARSSLLENYLQEACGPACQLGSASSVGGYNHQCALTFDGSVECWGSTVPNGLVAKQIVVGYKHSCALKIDGTVVFSELLSPQHSTVLSIFKAQENCPPAATCLATNPFGTVVSPCLSSPNSSAGVDSLRDHPLS
jgi:hypothetical protein